MNARKVERKRAMARRKERVPNAEAITIYRSDEVTPFRAVAEDTLALYYVFRHKLRAYKDWSDHLPNTRKGSFAEFAIWGAIQFEKGDRSLFDSIPPIAQIAANSKRFRWDRESRHPKE